MIGYVTTSTDAWSDADEGSAAAIEATCEHSAWELLEIVCDRENGEPLDRPGLTYALEQIVEGRSCGLLVSDLQSLGGSADDVRALVAWLRDVDATLVALDSASTPRPRRRPGPEHPFVLDLAEPERSHHQARNGGAGHDSTARRRSRITRS